tara:strand:- start:4836 stop:6002 length:1167 start_codon:yes stop_codon:yes gene_type:complete
MKKKIAIIGSTGSIGKKTFSIVKNNPKDFEIVLLTTNKNLNELYKQVKLCKVKNIIITSKSHFIKAKKKFKKKQLKIFNDLNYINKIFKKKIDYTMCSISGLDGLKPTLDSIKFSKKVAIANKESIICAWNLIDKQLKKFKTKFIPVDSEHFSIWSLINEKNKSNISKIYITASGGPFLNLPINKFKYINPKKATNHPRWKMGKKISIDSATMMNKVFEVIEAQRIFNVDINKFEILIHPNSYLHAIVKFNNGLIKMLFHDTDMKIPIFNSLYSDKIKKLNTKNINLPNLNNLNLSYPDLNRFQSLKILKKITNNISLYETVLITANDQLVEYFLRGKIKFSDINKNLIKIVNLKQFKNYQSKKPRDISQIHYLIEQVRLKTKYLCIK